MATKYTIALVAMAALCLLAAPALSMPSERGAPGLGGNCPMIKNLTPEQMGNMTLGELKEMMREQCNNSAYGENCSRSSMKANDSMMSMNRMHRGGRGMHMDGFGPKEGYADREDNEGCRCKGGDDMAPAGMAGIPFQLIADDLTVEKLNNMTLNQIRELKDQKMQAMDNMTLNQIKELKDKKMKEMNNMTINDLRQEHKNMREIMQILQSVSFSCKGKA